MKQLGEGIWVHEDTMSMPGMRLRLRMTIVELAGGGLWVHSPTALSPELAEEVSSLGSVNFIVGANNGHNIWIPEWHQAFPDARLYVSAGIPKKLNLSNYKALEESTENIWEEDLVHEYMSGVPFLNESVFLHQKSKSLIVTDLIQNHSDERPSGWKGLIAKCVFEPIGFKGMCVAPFLKMPFVIKDKSKFLQSIKRVQSWDFDRIIVTHGDIIESNAKQVFASLCERFLK